MVLHQVRVLRQVTLPSLSLGFPTGKMGTILPASPGWCTQQHHRGHRPGHRASVLQVRGGARRGRRCPPVRRAEGGVGRRSPARSRRVSAGGRGRARGDGGGAARGRSRPLAAQASVARSPASRLCASLPAASRREDGNRRAAREPDPGVAEERGREPQGQTGGGAGQAARRGA